MAKGNPFMGTARGKLADMVLYRRGGEQISRVRIRRIANPRTEAQLTNRVVVSTLSKRYAVLRPICDHAFQGFSTPARNMAEFMKQNSSMIQSDIQAARDTSTAWAETLFNFNGKNDFDAISGKTIVSKGSLPTIPAYTDTKVIGEETLAAIGVGQTAGLGTAPTYGDIARALGAQFGDQITLVMVVGKTSTATMRDIAVARFILAPSEGGETTPFMSNGAINLPNLKNKTDNVTISYSDSDGLVVAFNNVGEAEAVSHTVIMSRYEAGQWMRSISYLTERGSYEEKTMRLAIDSWDESIDSSMYLNKGQL